MGRPRDQHVDNKELDALVPWSASEGQKPGIPPETVQEAKIHLDSCSSCREKLERYRELVDRLTKVAVSKNVPPHADCPNHVDWYEVAAGLWPEFKATQLMMHAALCDHCGPLLRAATSVDETATPEEEALLAKLAAPSRPPTRIAQPERKRPSWNFMNWLVPAIALVVLFAVAIRKTPPGRPLSDPEFGQFAVSVHRQHLQGSLPLDVSADSQQTLNDWFKGRLPFSLALPASAALPGEERPYRLVGAKLVPAGGKTAAYIAYNLQTGPASLVVAPDSVATASGGVVLGFPKVTFHYRSMEGYRVVTWSLNGKTYALISQEENGNQRSCMVCHSAMRDRDLSQTPAPLQPSIQPMLQ